MKEFNFELTGFGKLSAYVNDAGDPWFLAKDVAKSLDYVRKGGKVMASDMTRFLDDDEKGTLNVRTLGGIQNVTVISESGLYHAIFMSRKPEANEFRKWVTSIVLPSVRKNGGYIDGQEELATEDRVAVTEKIKSLRDEVADLQIKLHKKNEKLRESRRFNEANRLLRKQYREALKDIDLMERRYGAQDRYIDYLVDRDADREHNMASLRADLFLAQTIMSEDQRTTYKQMKCRKANSSEYGCSKNVSIVLTDRNGFVV